MFGRPGHPLTSDPMIETVDQFADLIASAIELVMVLVIVIGSVRTIVAIAGSLLTRETSTPALRQIWLHYAAWILLALEFALAADIIKTIVGPSWTEIGQLGAIAAIRIALSYFLGRDIGEIQHGDGAEAT
jgi:uncharacterized membrane protein